MKWDKDGDGNEKYHPANIMTLKYNAGGAGGAGGADGDPVKTFAAFAPFYGHTVTRAAIQAIKTAKPAFGQDGCGYCHSADNCDIIPAPTAVQDDRLWLIRWNGTEGKLENSEIQGLIPLPEDYRMRFNVDFAEFMAGPGTACPTEANPSPIQFVETGPDLWQTGLDFAADAEPKNELGRPLKLDATGADREFVIFCPNP